jgi:hypothetical protein
VAPRPRRHCGRDTQHRPRGQRRAGRVGNVRGDGVLDVPGLPTRAHPRPHERRTKPAEPDHPRTGPTAVDASSRSRWPGAAAAMSARSAASAPRARSARTRAGVLPQRRMSGRRWWDRPGARARPVRPLVPDGGRPARNDRGGAAPWSADRSTGADGTAATVDRIPSAPTVTAARTARSDPSGRRTRSPATRSSSARMPTRRSAGIRRPPRRWPRRGGWGRARSGGDAAPASSGGGCHDIGPVGPPTASWSPSRRLGPGAR